MEACLPPQIEVDHLESNLNALRALDAGLAQRLARVRIPPTVQLTIAHDGTATFRIRSADAAGDAAEQWLGGSGAPAVRANALCNLFEPGIGNAIVIGIRHGRFVQRLAERLPANQAVFVFEHDLLNVRLALTVNDLSAALAAGRLVPIVPETGETPADALRRFLDTHTGYLVPDRLFAWPGAEDAALQAMAATIQRLSTPIEAERGAIIGHCRAGYDGAKRDDRRVLVAQASACWDTQVWLEQVAAALENRGYAVSTYSPCVAAQRHAAALADAIVNHAPAGCILLNAGAAQFGGVIPDGLPVVSWIGPDGAGIDLRQSAGGVFATSKSIAERLTRKGLPADRVSVLPMGRPTLETKATATGGMSASAEGSTLREILVIADAVDCAGQANGMYLDSHRKVWRALSSRLRTAAADLSQSLPTSALAQAEKETGICIEAGELRDLFERTAADRLWPTYRKLAVCERLNGAAVPFRIIGRGWQQFESVRGSATPTAADAVPARIAAAEKGDTVLDFERRGDLRAPHQAAVARQARVLLWGENDFTGGRVDAWLAELKAGVDNSQPSAGETSPPSLRDQVEPLLNRLGMKRGFAKATV